MFGIENYFGFVLAGIILNLTPGADTMYILTRSIAQGKRAGIYSVLGISSGALCHTIFAAFGLSIVLAKSPVIFSIIKYAGVCYLVFLGIRTLVEKQNIFENKTQQLEIADIWKIYRQGFFTNLLNPKVALFFLSLLPQFINPQYTNGPLPFLLLGLTFLTTGTIWCMILAFSASFISQTLRENAKIGKYMQKMSGIVFIYLGIKILVSK